MPPTRPDDLLPASALETLERMRERAETGSDPDELMALLDDELSTWSESVSGLANAYADNNPVRPQVESVLAILFANPSFPLSWFTDDRTYGRGFFVRSYSYLLARNPSLLFAYIDGDPHLAEIVAMVYGQFDGSASNGSQQMTLLDRVYAQQTQTGLELGLVTYEALLRFNQRDVPGIRFDLPTPPVSRGKVSVPKWTALLRDYIDEHGKPYGIIKDPITLRATQLLYFCLRDTKTSLEERVFHARALAKTMVHGLPYNALPSNVQTMQIHVPAYLALVHDVARALGKTVGPHLLSSCIPFD